MVTAVFFLLILFKIKNRPVSLQYGNLAVEVRFDVTNRGLRARTA